MRIEIREEEYKSFSESALDEGIARTLFNQSEFECEWPNPGNDFRYRIRSRGRVGIVPVGESVIVIHPKAPVSSIFGMLEVAYDLRSFELLKGESMIDSLEELFERVVSILAKRVLDRVRRGLYQQYVEHVDDLVYVRGRVDTRGNLRNAVRKNPAVRCRFEDLTPELEDNEILLWTLFVASRFPLKRPEVADQVRRAYRAMAGSIPLVEKSPQSCIARLYNRLNDDYRTMHGLCRLLLEHAGPHLAEGNRTFIPFCLDMPTLFESFVAKWLAIHLPPNLEVVSQYSAKLRVLTGNIDLGFVIDVVIRDRRTNRPLAVLDTKYKIAERPKEDDIQQVVAYATRMGVKHAFLVYPSSAGAGVVVTVSPPGDALDSRAVEICSLAFDIGSDVEEAGLRFRETLLTNLPRAFDCTSVDAGGVGGGAA